jgi:ribonucleoside-diphosphate reductase subunit M2
MATQEAYLVPYYKYRDDFVNPDIKEEPILSESSGRLTVYPIEYKSIWDNYKIQNVCHWVTEDIDFSKDVRDWNDALSDDDRYFLSHVLAFFASADGIVNANIKKNLIDVVQIKESECAYGKQFDMENTHGETYSLMLDAFIQDVDKKYELLNSIKSMECIGRKADWAFRWIDCDKTYAHKIVAFAIVEGVFFSGSFASIFWLKTRSTDIMPGLAKANRFISRDERLHVDLAIEHYKLLNNRLKESVVYQIVEEAIEIELMFINDALPCRLLGMNAQSMEQYVKYCSDRLLVQLGYRKKYNVDLPFDFMKRIDSYSKENFFEGRNDAYAKAAINNPRVFEFVEVC